MATTTTSQYVNLTEALADEVLEEDNRGRLVAANLINVYSIAGLKTKVKKLRRWDDPGPAGTATEGTAFTTTTQVSQASVSATPSEAAVQMILVTDDAIEVATGIESLAMLMQSGSFDQQFNALLPEAMIAGRSCFEKYESDVTGAFANFSSSVGSTGVDMTLANFDSALLTLESAEDLPHDDIVACLDKEQHGNLRTALMVTSGGVGGAIWSLDLASIVAQRPGLSQNGLKGSLLGVPVYVHGTSARQTANAAADVVGAMFLRGYGAPEDGDGGQPGAIAAVERRRLQFTVEHDHRERGGEVQANWVYAIVERVDKWGVAIITDAP